jgi:tetratricopeptide (TPR) repeat protein
VGGAIVRRSFRHEFAGVKNWLLLMLRWTWIVLVSFSVAFLAVQAFQRTTWFKERIYQMLVTGDEAQRLKAASLLSEVRGEAQLLRALKSEQPAVREMARRGLDHLWFTGEGDRAYDEMLAACKLANGEDYAKALPLLDKLTAKHPRYAEAWNRRASVLWQMGKFKESMSDSRRALELNPNHFSAWQGLGLCQLELGDISGACKSLRAALDISPHDQSTRESLQRCEQLLQTKRPAAKLDRKSHLI